MKFYLFSKLKENGEIVFNYLSKIGEVTSSLSECDIIVSVGGDGTLLNTGKKAIAYDKPIVGINAGHLGYLCAFKIEEIASLSLNDFLSLKESHRTLIEYNGEVAINEICVLKANPVQSIEVGIKGIATWKGDGLIVSTATGSSSYNQSAGGPILDPLSTDLVVTPVCPHFSKVGPQIIKDDAVVVNVSNRTKALLTVDTKVIGEVNEPVVIKKSNKVLRLLTR